LLADREAVYCTCSGTKYENSLFCNHLCLRLCDPVCIVALCPSAVVISTSRLVSVVFQSPFTKFHNWPQRIDLRNHLVECFDNCRTQFVCSNVPYHEVNG